MASFRPADWHCHNVDSEWLSNKVILVASPGARFPADSISLNSHKWRSFRHTTTGTNIIDKIKDSFLINSGRVKLIHLRPGQRDNVSAIGETFAGTIPEDRMNVIQFGSFSNLKELIYVRIWAVKAPFSLSTVCTESAWTLFNCSILIPLNCT